MHHKMKRHGVMQLPEIIDLLYHLMPRVKEVCPFGMQEPFLDPRLTAILCNIKQLNTRAGVTVYTNMSRYNQEQWRKIFDWGLIDNLIVSFYGVNQQVYREMQQPLNYYQTICNIKKLKRQRERLGWIKPCITLELLITPETLLFANKFRKKWSKYVDRVGFTHYDCWLGNLPYNLEFERRTWRKEKRWTETRTPCQRLWQTCTVHYDGTMVPCCLDYDDKVPLGNIFDDYDLWWTSPILAELRKLHASGRWSEIPLCKDCVAWRSQHNKSWVETWKQKLVSVSSAVKR
jgi:radical SAM protein with 4Fe4S-binding SPASM domain